MMVPFGLQIEIGCVAGCMLLIGSVIVKKWPVALVSAPALIKFVEVILVGAPDE